MKLSILIPSIPSRFPLLYDQWDMIAGIVGDKDVEILAFTDNKKRSIGLKRDALVQMAHGEYLAFVDDDDEVYPCYVEEMLKGIESGSDVISIRQHATIERGNKFRVDFGVSNPNEEARQVNDVWVDVMRKPFHTCAWKTEIAKRHHFPDASYGEDWHWCKRVLEDVKTEHKIMKPLLCYHWSETVTEAAHVFPKD